MMNRQPQRILLKLSWEACKGNRPSGFDVQVMHTIAKHIITLKKRGFTIAIVVWGWNFFRGKTWEELGMQRAAADYIGMLATVMNSLALEQSLAYAWEEAVVMSAIDMPKIAQTWQLDSALKVLEEGKILICAAWLGAPYISSDLGAVTRALELSCDVLVKATKVDWVYDRDPVLDPTAKKYDILKLKDALARWLDIMDHAAIALAMDHQLPLYVCHIDHIESLGTQDMDGTWVE